MSDEVKVLRKRVLVSPLWIMPIAAAIISIWMVLNGHINSGDDITIEFDSSVGLAAGKTSLVYKGLEVGKVTEINISEKNPDRVVVIARLKKGAGELARSGSSFWIVRPRVGFNEISNLDTLLTGAYIAVKPPTLDIEKLKEIPRQDHFEGESVPPADYCSDCAQVSFYSSDKSNIDVGTRIYYRGFAIGQVSAVNLDKKSQRVIFKGSIENSYKDLLNYPIYFWNQLPFDVDFDSNHLTVKTASLESFAKGRIDMGVFQYGKSKNYSRLHRLYTGESEARKNILKKNGGRVINIVASEIGNLQKGSFVYYKKIAVGEIDSFALSEDRKSVNLSIFIYPKYTSLLSVRSYFIVSNLLEIDSGSFSIKMPKAQELVNGSVELVDSALDLSPLKGNRNGGDYLFFLSTQDAEQKIQSIRTGLRLTLRSQTTKSIVTNSPILYRQIPVGRVEWVKLEERGSHILFGAFIEDQYRYLVNNKTRFWNASGIQASMSISGIKVKTDSLKSIVEGGIAFATPTAKDAKKVKNGESFQLFNQAEEEWLEWSGPLR